MSQFNHEQFCERLKESLKSSGMTLKEAANNACIAPHMLRKYIEGQSIPRVGDLRKICAVFHVRADYLLGISQ